MADVDPHDAADRIEAFLDRRAQMLGIDQEEIVSLDGGEHRLLVEDLRALANGYRQIFSEWVIP